MYNRSGHPLTRRRLDRSSSDDDELVNIRGIVGISVTRHNVLESCDLHVGLSCRDSKGGVGTDRPQ
jgi:hypothetical protein